MPRPNKRKPETAGESRKKAKVSGGAAKMRTVLKKMTMRALSRISSAKELHDIWKDLKETGLQGDKALLRRAMESDFDAKSLTSPLWDDKEFTINLFLDFVKKKLDEQAEKRKDAVLHALQQDNLKWSRLSYHLKRDADILVASRDLNVFAKGMFEIIDKSKLWRWVMNNLDDCCIRNKYWTLCVPYGAARNEELLLNLLQQSTRVMRCVDKSLYTDDFLSKALQANPRVLGHFKSKIEDSLVDTVWNVDSLHAYREAGGNVSKLEEEIPSRIWNCKEFALAWVRNGGRLSDMPSACHEDEEVLLEFARQNKAKDHKLLAQFGRMSFKSRSSTELGGKILNETHAMNVLPILYSSVQCRLSVLLQACALSTGCILPLNFSEEIGEKLNEYRGFFEAILCGSQRENHPVKSFDEPIIRAIGLFLGMNLGPYFFQAAANLGHPSLFGIKPCFKFS